MSNYQLTSDELKGIHKKYGLPGEVAPGQPATKKRKRFDTSLSDRGHKENANAINKAIEGEEDVNGKAP